MKNIFLKKEELNSKGFDRLMVSQKVRSKLEEVLNKLCKEGAEIKCLSLIFKSNGSLEFCIPNQKEGREMTTYLMINGDLLAHNEESDALSPFCVGS